MTSSIDAPAGILNVPAFSLVSFFISAILFKNACESVMMPCVFSALAIELAELPAAMVILRSAFVFVAGLVVDGCVVDELV